MNSRSARGVNMNADKRKAANPLPKLPCTRRGTCMVHLS